MADYGRTIYLGEPSATDPKHNFKEMLPGRVAVLMDKSETRNGIYMPASGRLSPDSGTVLASGVEELPEGQRVLTRAYNGDELTGKWMYIEGRLVKLYGVADDWFSDVVAKVDGEQIIPAHDWIYIMRHLTDDGGIVRSDKRKDKWRDTATIMALGHSAEYEYDRRGGRHKTGLSSKTHIKYKGEALNFKFGNIPEEMGLIRLSQVLAVVE